MPLVLMLLTLATTACGLPTTELVDQFAAQGSSTVDAGTTGAMTTPVKTTDSAEAGSNKT